MPVPYPHSRLDTINTWLDDNIIPYCGLLASSDGSPTSRQGPPGRAAQFPAAAGRGAMMRGGISRRVRDRLEGAVFGALVGDALALSAHYEYDSEKIWRAYGGQVIRSFDKPGSRNRTPGWAGGEPTNFHPTKGAGDLTDYGDNAVFLLEALAADPNGQWDAGSFSRHWKSVHQRYNGYRTMATRHTYQNLREGLSGIYAASDIDDMGGATRTVGLLLSASNETEVLSHAAEACQLTHKHPVAVVAAQFVALSAWRVAWRGEQPRAAMEAAVGIIGDDTLSTLFHIAIRKLTEATDSGTALNKQGDKRVDDLALTSMLQKKWSPQSEVWMGGKASPVHGALPGSIYFILKYADQAPEQGLRNALAFNAMVGGDSSARALPIGMILGAQSGIQRGVPEEWLMKLNCRQSVQTLVDQVLAKRNIGQ